MLMTQIFPLSAFCLSNLLIPTTGILQPLPNTPAFQRTFPWDFHVTSSLATVPSCLPKLPLPVHRRKDPAHPLNNPCIHQALECPDLGGSLPQLFPCQALPVPLPAPQAGEGSYWAQLLHLYRAASLQLTAGLVWIKERGFKIQATISMSSSALFTKLSLRLMASTPHIPNLSLQIYK